MNFRSYFSFFFFLLISLPVSFCQLVKSLPRSLPETQGVSSVGILQFLDAANKSKTEFHSFMLLRHGKVIAEGWWNPYKADLKHTLYSCSKSFTATAIGFAIAEKRIALTDKLISFFPDWLPDSVTSYLAALTVKNLLTMSDGQDPDPSFIVAAHDSNWIRGFLHTPIKYEPGTRFLYNSLGTYMLSAIIQKVTGQKLVDYLKPRLFDPLDIEGMDWETDIQDINTGGWGLRLKTEDMAKFAQLFLQNGRWHGKQVLPAGWVREASTMKIMQDPNAPAAKRDSSDWLQGYCYQMWRCRNDAYRGDGAYGQFMIIMPDQDAVLAITAETADMQDEINLVWKYLLPAFKKTALPPNKAGDQRLKEKISSLHLPLLAPNAGSTDKALSGKTFLLAENSLRLREISFSFNAGSGQLEIQTDQGTFPFNLGAGKWAYSESNMPGPSLVAGAIEKRYMLYPARVAGLYTWSDPHTLKIKLCYIESPHSLIITCHFESNKLDLEWARSLDFGKTSLHISGDLK